MNPAAKEPAKKAYHAPQIHIYGNILALTQNVGKSGKKDGGFKKDRSRL